MPCQLAVDSDGLSSKGGELFGTAVPAGEGQAQGGVRAGRRSGSNIWVSLLTCWSCQTAPTPKIWPKPTAAGLPRQSHGRAPKKQKEGTAVLRSAVRIRGAGGSPRAAHTHLCRMMGVGRVLSGAHCNKMQPIRARTVHTGVPHSSFWEQRAGRGQQHSPPAPRGAPGPGLR